MTRTAPDSSRQASRTSDTGLRSLRKNPGYAAAAIVTLALGIGANTAIFSVVHGVLLQGLPYGGCERLVRIQVDALGAGITDGAFSPLEIADLQNLSHTLDGVAEYHSMWFVLLGKTSPSESRRASSPRTSSICWA